MTMVEVPVDNIDITVDPPPSIAIESIGTYEREMDGASPEWFKPMVATLFAQYDAWFESPATTAALTYKMAASIANNQDRLWGETGRSKITDVVLNPNFRQYVQNAFLGRMQRAEAGRLQIMHRLMQRQIVVLTYNQRTMKNAIIAMMRNVEADIRLAVKAEKTNREAGDRALLKVIADLNARTAAETRSWVTHEVVPPLLVFTKGAYDRATSERIAADSQLHTSILNEVLPKIAAVAATALATSKVVNTLQQESEECVKPMCETHGPKTPLGRLFNALKDVKFLALLAAFEAMDVKDLEKIANAVAGTEGQVGSWVATQILQQLIGEHG